MTYIPSRYRVSGLQDGVPVYTLFKSVKSALVFAYKLSEAEVYDMVSKDYIKKPVFLDNSKNVYPITS